MYQSLWLHINGSTYLKEQIDSILCQLEPGDELIISDDGPSDFTFAVLEEYKELSYVTVISGQKEGVGNNFINGIMHCINEIVLFADQDYISWIPGIQHYETVGSLFFES